MLRLYNTLTRKVEAFKPITGEKVGMYACGPTVYDYAHIGNLRTYIFNDLLKRVLSYLGFKVIHVMNLTDVDDKTIAAARQEKVPLREYTDRYIKIFFEDLEKLNIIKPDITPRATDHIEEMIKMIKTLVDKGLAYKSADGSIYYDIRKFPQYGQLSGAQFVKGLKAGARISADEYDREQAADFALWKAYTPGDGEVFWDSPFGKGRPGWHIECSAMSTKYLGESFELHTGAVDLIFPHHENEVAQTVGVTGKPWVKYWVHGEHLLVEGKKMSKSLGNIYKLDDIVRKGFNPLALRFLFLSGHYRQVLNFTWEGMTAAQNALNRLYVETTVMSKGDKNEFNPLPGAENAWKEKFVEAISNDLNMPQVLAVVWELLSPKTNLGKIQKYNLLLEFDKVLGLNLKEESAALIKEAATLKIPREVKELIEEREQLRKEKKFSEADKVRKEIEEKGWIIEDTAERPVLKPKK